VISAGGDLDPLIVAAAARPVNDPVICSYSSRPPAREIAAQGLGLADPLERASSNILQKNIDPL